MAQKDFALHYNVNVYINFLIYMSFQIISHLSKSHIYNEKTLVIV
jgi:hypothetical protein